MKLNGFRKFTALISAFTMTASAFTAFAVPAGAAELEPLPEGAVDVGAVTVKTANAKTTAVTEENGAARTVAYTTTNDGVWYLGDYDISEIESIEARAALVPKIPTDGSAETDPELKFAYMPIEDGKNVTDETGYGDTNDKSYIDGNSGTIRNSAHLIAGVKGYTKPESNAEDGHKYSGAVFTFDADGVTVDEAAYAEYPGGEAKVISNTPLTVKGTGKVHLFVYGTAQSCRITIDYVKINTKQPIAYNKIDLTDKQIIKFAAKGTKDTDYKHTVNNGGAVTATGQWNSSAVGKIDLAYHMVNGTVDVTTNDTAHTNNNTTYAYFIDLGEAKTINRIVLKNVSASAIVTAVGGSAEHQNGYITTNDGSDNSASFTFNNEWARVNDSLAKNLTNVTAVYGSKISINDADGANPKEVYDTVTLEGDFGKCRYIAFDGNGSASYIGEIEAYTPDDVQEPTETATPTASPTVTPTTAPTGSPTVEPGETEKPTASPTVEPGETEKPTASPTAEPVDKSPATLTADVVAQLRATDDTWSKQHNNSNQFIDAGTDKENAIETTAKNYFGVFYSFGAVSLPEGATVTKATLSVYQGSSKFSGKPFVVKKTENPADISSIADVFAAAAAVKISGEEIGQTKTAVLEDGNRTESVDVTKYFTAGERNSYLLYNADAGDNNRQLSRRAEIVIEFTVSGPVETAKPTATPTTAPTASPTVTPTTAPTASPTVTPTTAPTASPTVTPTTAPTASPTVTPTTAPTATPTTAPTASPTVTPTTAPTASPTVTPTTAPTVSPTVTPTTAPTASPTVTPTTAPTASPTVEPVDKSPATLTADVVAQLRATDDTWSKQHSNSNQFIEAGTDKENTIETTAKNYFGVFYSFGAVSLPEGATVTKATLSVYQGSSKFSGKPFVVKKTKNPADINSIADVFAAAAAVKVSGEEIGQTKTAVLEDGNRTESVDVTKYFTAGKRNSYLLYNADAGDNNRQLSRRAELVIEFTIPGPAETAKPTATPGATEDPTKPTATPGATEDPVKPTATPGATEDPTKPTATPGAPTSTPTAEPTNTPEPTPTVKPTPLPTVEPKVEYNFDEPYEPEQAAGVTVFEPDTPLDGWFGNNAAETGDSSVKIEDGQLVITNGYEESNSMWVGTKYAEIEEASAADRIEIRFVYTPGSEQSRIYFVSTTDEDISNGIDAAAEGIYRIAGGRNGLGMSAGETYDVLFVIDNLAHKGQFTVTPKDPDEASLDSVLEPVDLPDGINAVAFRPAPSAEGAATVDKVDDFSAALIDTKLEIKDITAAEGGGYNVNITAEGMDENTAIIAALYRNGVMTGVKLNAYGSVTFADAQPGDEVKAFMWDNINNKMRPMTTADSKTIE